MGFPQASVWEEGEVSQSDMSTEAMLFVLLTLHIISYPCILSSRRMRNVWMGHTACSVSYKLEKDAAGLSFRFLCSLIASSLYHPVSLSPASFISIFENDEQSSVTCPEGDCQNTLNYAVVQHSFSSLSSSFKYCWKKRCSDRLGGQDFLSDWVDRFGFCMI